MYNTLLSLSPNNKYLTGYFFYYFNNISDICIDQMFYFTWTEINNIKSNLPQPWWTYNLR